MNNSNELKSRQFFTTAFIIAIVFIIIASIAVPAFESAPKNGIALSFNDGWYIETADGGFEPFTAFGQSLDQDRIVLIHEHDDDLNRIDALGLYNYYSAVEVYVGEKMIYSYGSMDDINNHVYLGNYYSMIDIHRHEMAESEIRVVFLNSNPQTIYGFTGGNGGALEMALVREYIVTLLTPIVSVIFLIVAVYLRIRKRDTDLLNPSNRWLLIFALTLSAWELADSQILMDMGYNAGSVCLASFEIFMLMPVPLLMFVYHSCKKQRSISFVFCALIFANFLVLNVLHFAHIKDFLYSLTSTHIVVFASLAYCLVEILLDYVTRHDLRSIVLLGGYSLFVLFAAMQYLQFFIDPTASNTKFLQIGLLLFLISQFAVIAYYANQRTDQIVRKLEKETSFLKTKFRSFVPDDVIQQRLEKEELLAKTGELKYLTVLESDIRGFSQLIQDMTAEAAIDMLNHYLENMTAILTRQDGLCLEFVGDAVIALFDEEHAGPRHADKAVIAAVQMQYVMNDINAWNIKRGYPSFEMGIGIHTGNVYVGYIGSEERMEYDAIGSTMNLVSRIENYSTGGQILISPECKKNISIELIIGNSFIIHPKGYRGGMEVFQISGLGEPYNIYGSTIEKATVPMEKPIPITYNVIMSKSVGEQTYQGLITEISRTNVMFITQHSLELYDNLKFNYNEDFTCKVISKSERGVLLRFTSTPPDFALDNQNERQGI